MLLATHIIEEGRGARPKPRESRQMSRRPSPREFREIWLRIGLVLATRKYWVGNWATVGVLIFIFISKISYWECFLGTLGDAPSWAKALCIGTLGERLRYFGVAPCLAAASRHVSPSNCVVETIGELRETRLGDQARNRLEEAAETHTSTKLWGGLVDDADLTKMVEKFWVTQLLKYKQSRACSAGQKSAGWMEMAGWFNVTSSPAFFTQPGSQLIPAE